MTQFEPAAALELVQARNLELVASQRLAAVDDTALGGCAAHIEGEQIVRAERRPSIAAISAPAAGPDSSSRTG